MARPLCHTLVRLGAALAGASTALNASAWVLEGRLEAQARSFYHQTEHAESFSAAFAPVFRHDWGDGQHRLEGELFYRHDDTDRRRSHGDIRSLYYQYRGRDWEWLAGTTRSYWGVTESRQLVDVLNQADFVEDLDAEQKLGQPMLALSWLPAAARIDLYLLPYQRARTFPGVNGQPRLPFPVAPEEARYESSREQQHLDWAARGRFRFGALDLNLSLFDGTAREPDLLPCLRRGAPFEGTADGPNCDIESGLRAPEQPLPHWLFSLFQGLGLLPDDDTLRQQFIAEQTPIVLANLVLVPHYARLRQVGLDAQFITGGWALKLETLLREQGGQRSAAAVGGFEYTLPVFFNTGWDVGLLAEYLYDERRSIISTRVDNDVFLATRIGFNDIAGSQILAGFFFDRRGRDHLLQVEASRRFGQDWRGSLKLRHFERVPGDDFTGFLDDEDMVSLTLERFF